MTLQKDLDTELAVSLLEAEFLVDFWCAYSDEPAAPWPDRKEKKKQTNLKEPPLMFLIWGPITNHNPLGRFSISKPGLI